MHCIWIPANYNFPVFIKQILLIVLSVAKEDHTENDCFVLVVMSHGAEGRIFASDMSYPVERLWQPFLGENCNSLVNKPKVFFVQVYY